MSLPRIDKDAQELLPELVEHCLEVKRMDDSHGELYLFGETKDWVSPWQASELATVKMMGGMLELGASDVVLDLGCGDGRVNLALSRLFGCRGVGWDSSSLCIDTCNLLLRSSGMHKLNSFSVVNFLHRGEWDLGQLATATVLYTYLPVQGLLTLLPLLEYVASVNPTVRLVTNHYHFPNLDEWQVIHDQHEIRVCVYKGRSGVN
ncbi:hypothetical protein BASA81_001201 [Batrachochytrium salamandrivorans]|nr:hypothetical protein BASA81_001201 [Batrachochytrium salamandrivorans]